MLPLAVVTARPRANQLLEPHCCSTELPFLPILNHRAMENKPVWVSCIWKLISGARWTAQQLRAHIVVTEDLALVPSTHTGQVITNAYNSSSGDLDLSGLKDNLNKLMKVHTHTHMHKNIWVNLKKKTDTKRKSLLVSLNCLSHGRFPYQLPMFQTLLSNLIPTTILLPASRVTGFKAPDSTQQCSFFSQYACIIPLSLLSYSQGRVGDTDWEQWAAEDHATATLEERSLNVQDWQQCLMFSAGAHHTLYSVRLLQSA